MLQFPYANQPCRINKTSREGLPFGEFPTLALIYLFMHLCVYCVSVY